MARHIHIHVGGRTADTTRKDVGGAAKTKDRQRKPAPPVKTCACGGHKGS